MRIVVTGATGNVGTSVVRALAADPQVDEIVGVARRLPRWQSPRTRWVSADVVTSALEPVFEGADAVIHLAWLIQPSHDPNALRAVNVEGSRRVFDAAVRAGAGVLVHASSVGVYSPGPKDRRVDESWPNGGVPSSFYARHKAEAERLLDDLESEIRIVRLRPALVFKRDAASGIRRLFIGPLLPSPLVQPRLLPALPWPSGLALQAVHSHDVGEAYRLAATSPDARGAYNVAAEPVLDAPELGRLLQARPVAVPPPRRARGREGHLARTPPADAAGLARHGARRAADGQLAGARGARLGAAAPLDRCTARAPRRAPALRGPRHAAARDQGRRAAAAPRAARRYSHRPVSSTADENAHHPGETASVLSYRMGIQDANVAGNVHGGWIMKLCDDVAAIAATRHAGGRVVTATVDEMRFRSPIHVGDVVTLRATVNAAWRTSMEVGVRVEAEHVASRKINHTCSAYLTMVALGADEKPIPLPPLVPETEEDERRHRDANVRRELRLAKPGALRRATA